MLTKNNNPELSYLSRVLALPLMALLIMAFTIKQKNKTAGNDTASDKGLIISDTVLTKQPTALRAYKDKTIQWIYNDSLGKKISWNIAQTMGFTVNEKEFQAKIEQSDKDYIESNLKLPSPELLADTLIDDNPLIVIDGKEMGKFRSMKNELVLSPEKIQSMNVLKGENAIAKYGQKGKDGVIEITTKKALEAETPVEKIRIRGQNSSDQKPLTILDGKEWGDDLDKLQADNIQSITVLKGATATAMYGPKASEGAIIITTKSGTGVTNPNVKPVDGVKIRLTEKKLSQTDLNEVVVVGYGKNNDDPNKIFEKVENEAQFPGGSPAWLRYLQRNLNANVPSEHGAPDGSYTVELQFIVQLDGSLSDIKALTKHGYGMEEEAIRALGKGPKWVPAQQNEKKVVSYRKQTITFVITSV